jgi:hypothetical protein
MSNDLLFSKADWFAVERARKELMATAISSLDPERLLNSSLEDLATYFEGEYELDVPELMAEEAAADQKEKDIDVSRDPDRYWGAGGPQLVRGTEVSVIIPFTGNPELFYVQPTTFTMNSPRAEIKGTSLIIRVAGINPDPKRVKAEIDNRIQSIQGYLANLRKNGAGFNSGVRAEALRQLTSRKEKLLRDRNLVSELGFKLKERPGMSKTYAAPEVKRKIKPKLPPQSAAPFKPEPAILTEDYEHILKVLQDVAIVMERSPLAFASINEEALRMHFLMQLNGHYEGQATGETFNFGGKTDILLRVEGRNVFLAECKFWGGPKMLTETVDQLLSYSSWRDSKTAILIFNRRRNFTKVLEAISPTIEVHPNYKRTENVPGDTLFRFILGNKDDPAREIMLTVLAFDVPEPST